MASAWRFVLFLTIVLTVWTGMHAYVLWRLWPLVPPALWRRILLGAFGLLWALYPLGRILAHQGMTRTGKLLEVVGASWMGVLFLALACVFIADAVSGFGWLLPKAAPALRLAALGAAALLSVLALVQGLRPPAVREAEVRLPGLPRALDGTVLVQMSDLHLGSLLGRGWLEARIAQVESLRPDLVAVTGDLVDGDAAEVERLLPTLRTLKAPLGVWAVTGNHEYYAGVDRCVALMEQAGITVLRDRSQEAAPGLVIAGVDDLSARRQFHLDGDPVTRALSGRPPGATVFLCHSPLEAEKAAALGAGLMLSGHTHGGQIWPFGYLVALAYPHVEGRYAIGPMALWVGRGTGTWGPPMRLFRPSEIWRFTLRAP
jgi:predicted MPP superfamily phosphohydrolase